MRQVLIKPFICIITSRHTIGKHLDTLMKSLRFRFFMFTINVSPYYPRVNCSSEGEQTKLTFLMASPPFKNTEHELRDQQETFEACAQVSLFYPSATIHPIVGDFTGRTAPLPKNEHSCNLDIHDVVKGFVNSEDVALSDARRKTNVVCLQSSFLCSICFLKICCSLNLIHLLALSRPYGRLYLFIAHL